MPWFGLRAKRSRTRGPQSKRPSLSDRLWETLTDYALIGRILLVLGTVASLLLILEAWSVPFPFREGDYFAHGLAARQDFTLIDAEETRRKRDRAAQRTPRVFRNDTTALIDLPEQLRIDLGRIATAESLGELPIETRQAFGLIASNAEAPAQPTEQIRQRFLALKAAVEPKGPQPTAERIEAIRSDFEQFLQPLYANGVIAPDDVSRLALDRDSRISVLPQRIGATDAEAGLSGELAGEGATIPNGPSTETVADGVNRFGGEAADGSGLELAQSVTALLPEVRLADQLTDAGLLGRTWGYYPDIPEAIRPAIAVWLDSQIDSTLSYDESATSSAERAARALVPDEVKRYAEGELLVPPRHLLSEDDLPLLEREHEAAEMTRGTLNRTVRFGLLAGLLAVLTAVNGYHVLRSEPRIVRRAGRLSVYLVTIILAVAIAKWLANDPWRAEIIPLVIVAMVFSIAYDQVLATALALTLCVLVTLATTSSLAQLITLMSVSTASVLMVGRVASRSTLVKVGYLSAVIYFFVALGIRVLATEMPLSQTLDHSVLGTALLGSAWCILAGYLVSGSLPIVERLFGVVTDISLLELSDPSHPLLQELVRRAPGTYSHSMSVASISEKAAEAIGANGLLCRVAAYFHDCGKMIKPEYFIENVPSGAESRHESLSPAMSTLVIIGHVKDGVDLAERHNLPQVLTDFIEQHHGTTLVEYFYREAQKRAEADDEPSIDEAGFRYPGPKPQTREAACMMLADCCESASRTLTDPTAKRIAALVESLTMKRLLDGQFEECEMTLAEINQVRAAVSKSLTAMYHGRVKYPDAEDRKDSKSA